jgi:hypothetical protein
MFDRMTVTIAGLPAGAIIIAVGFVLTTVGCLWIRRITQGEPERPRTSFRAFAERPFIPASSLILGAVLLGFVSLFAGSSWFTVGEPGEGVGATGTTRGWLLNAGLALEALAVALTARRLWIRWHL